MPEAHIKNYRERLWDAFERVILPHVRLEERGNVREAVREFESKESDYFLKDDGPKAGVPMALPEKALQIFNNILSLPGMKQLLSAYGAAIEAAVRGRPVIYDPTIAVFPQDITPIPPEEAPTDTLERYLSIAPAFRTHFTNNIIKIVQQMDRIEGMSLQDFQLAKAYLTSPEFSDGLYQSYFDLRDLLYEHGAMLTALHNYVKRSFFAGDQQIRIYRVHINMTALNERDGNNKLGNLYIEMTHLALQSRFETVHTVKSPERTAFMFVGPSIEQAAGIMSGIEQEVRLLMKDALAALPETTPEERAEKARQIEAFGNFKPKVVASQRELTTENLLQYAIRSREDAVLFKDLLNHAMGIKPSIIESSDFKDILQLFIQGSVDFENIIARVKDHPELMKTTYALITKGLLEMVADLCAQTNFFEKEDKSGRILFDESDLPKQGDAKFKVWRRYQRGKYGFVGPGIYDPASHGVKIPKNPELPIFSDVGFTDETDLERRISSFQPDPLLPDGVNQINKVFPPFNRIAGHVSHRALKGKVSSGGAIEGLLDAINVLAAEIPSPGMPIFPATQDGLEAKLEIVRQRAHEASIAFRNLYRWAVTEQRHKLMPRVYERFPVRRGRNYQYVPADFVLQEIALQSVYAMRKGAETLFMIAEEYDSARARNDALAAKGIERLDIDDGVFSAALNPVWQLAAENGLPLPVVRREGGDHLTVSFTNVSESGDAVDPYEWALNVQEAVGEDNITFKFQEYTKVDIQVFRLTGKGLGEVVRPEFMEEMRQDLNLAAQPQHIFGEGENHDIGVEFQDREGNKINADTVRDYLAARGVEVKGVIKVGEDMKRMLTWKDGGELVYGAFKADGFEPFERTFSITLALGEFPLVIYAGDEALFHSTEKYINLAMGDVKKASLPNKQGRADLREKSPMYETVFRDPVSSKIIKRDDIGEDYIDGMVRRVRGFISQRIKEYRSRFLSEGGGQALLAAEIEHDTTTGAAAGVVRKARDVINWFGAKLGDPDYAIATRHRFTRLFSAYQMLGVNIGNGHFDGVLTVGESRNAETLIDEIAMRLGPLAQRLGRFIAVQKTDRNVDRGANIDYETLDEIAYEYLNNAIKYGERYVMIGFKRDEAARAYVLWVANDGSKIPDGLDIWGPGVKGDHPPEIESSGYGLYVVMKLAEKLGWRVTHEWDEEAGLTIFKLFIPIKSETPSGSSSGGIDREATIEFVELDGYEGDQSAAELSPAARAQLLQGSGAAAFMAGAAIYTGAPAAAQALTPVPVFVP